MHHSKSAMFLPLDGWIMTEDSVAKASCSQNVERSFYECTNLGSFSYWFNLDSNLAPLAHMKITRTGFDDVPAKVSGQR